MSQGRTEDAKSKTEDVKSEVLHLVIALEEDVCATESTPTKHLLYLSLTTQLQTPPLFNQHRLARKE